jgi:fructose-bisphosphate aldolase class I
MSEKDKKAPAKSPKFDVPFLPKNPFEAELIATAKAVAAPGKGILAADESTGTIGKRFESIGVKNTREARREFRRLLFTAKDIGKYISGVIMFEETLFETTEDKKTQLIEFLKKENIQLGIKVDQGTKHLPGTDDETYTQGLTDLDTRCKKYYKQGARFAKWRAVVRISKSTPSPYAIHETAWGLARYAAICQANGLVPIVEPEILMDGDHSLEVCQYWTEKVVGACYKALNDQNVILEGTLLKPNMVIPGQQSSELKSTSTEQIAKATVQAFQRTVPPAVPGIMFLSGGQTEEEASVRLNALNSLPLGPRPWSLSFSYGRALQASALKAWKGKTENVEKAQEAFIARAKANGEAQLGKYKGSASGAASKECLFVSGYKY